MLASSQLLSILHYYLIQAVASDRKPCMASDATNDARHHCLLLLSVSHPCCCCCCWWWWWQIIWGAWRHPLLQDSGHSMLWYLCRSAIICYVIVIVASYVVLSDSMLLCYSSINPCFYVKSEDQKNSKILVVGTFFYLFSVLYIPIISYLCSLLASLMMMQLVY